MNLQSKVKSIQIEGPIGPIFKLHKNITFIDIPGPNHSMNENQETQLEKALKLTFHKILYVMNATQLATDDDRLLLQRMLKHLKSHPQQEIIFIVNKVDEVENNEVDFLVNLKENVIAYLKLYGFAKPNVILLSALAAKLAQKALYNKRLSRREHNKLHFFQDIFTNEDFNLEKYATFKCTKEIVDYSGQTSVDYEEAVLKKIIKHSGLLNVLRSL